MKTGLTFEGSYKSVQLIGKYPRISRGSSCESSRLIIGEGGSYDCEADILILLTDCCIPIAVAVSGP